MNDSWKYAKEDWFVKEVEQVISVFSKHKIVKEFENGWFIAKEVDGKFCSNYYYEVINLINGRLFIGGDINDVVYAYGPTKSKIELLKWIGDCNDFGYLCSKAKIGSNPEVVRFSKRKAISELNEKLEFTANSVMKKVIKEILDSNFVDKNSYIETIQEYDSYMLYEELAHLGEIPSNTILYSWAAARHLCSLL